MNKLELNEITKLSPTPCEENIGFFFKVLYNYYGKLQKGGEWLIKIAQFCQSIDVRKEEAIALSGMEWVKWMDETWKAAKKTTETESDQDALRDVFNWHVNVYASILRYLIVKRVKLPVRDPRMIYYCKGSVNHGCAGRFIPENIDCPKCLGWTVRLGNTNDMMLMWNKYVPEAFAFEMGMEEIESHKEAPVVVETKAPVVVETKAHVVVVTPKIVITPPIPKIQKAKTLPKVTPPTSTEHLMDLLTNMTPTVTPSMAFFEYTRTHSDVFRRYIVPLIEHGVAVTSKLVDGEQRYLVDNYRIVPDHHQKCGPMCYFVTECAGDGMVMFNNAEEVVDFFTPKEVVIDTPMFVDDESVVDSSKVAPEAAPPPEVSPPSRSQIIYEHVNFVEQSSFWDDNTIHKNNTDFNNASLTDEYSQLTPEPLPEVFPFFGGFQSECAY